MVSLWRTYSQERRRYRREDEGQIVTKCVSVAAVAAVPAASAPVSAVEKRHKPGVDRRKRVKRRDGNKEKMKEAY